MRWILVALALAACGTNQRVDAPYEACGADDGCSHGTSCVSTTLPASAGFNGYSCTTGCNADQDCLQDLSNFDAICVNHQCYIACPDGGRNCPYGTGCLAFVDQDNIQTNICTP